MRPTLRPAHFPSLSEAVMLKPTAPLRFAPMILGCVLCGGGFLHMWFHAQWGSEDWGVITMIVLGAGLMANEQVVGLIRAWRGK
jgi:hypothetical protein